MKSIVRFALLGSLAAFAQINAATAQTSVVPNFNLDNVESLLERMSVPHFRKTTDGGVVLQAQLNNVTFYFQPLECTSGPCKGLHIFAFSSFQPGAISMGDINQHNQSYVASKAMWLGQSSALLSRYLIGDYGVIDANFAVEVNVFVTLMNKFLSTDFSGASTIAFDENGAEALTRKYDNQLVEPFDHQGNRSDSGVYTVTLADTGETISLRADEFIVNKAK